MRTSSALGAVAGALALALAAPALQASGGAPRNFERVATFPVYRNMNDVEFEGVAEIVTATADGMQLIYTDAAEGGIGFVGIANPADPQPLGYLPLDGEPTSVAVRDGKALVAVDTTDGDFTSPSGYLAIVDIASQTVDRIIDLAGQPDSVAVSPNKRFAAIAIENQRDEEFEVGGVEGGLPQAPGGDLVIVDLVGPVANWSIRRVDLTGLPILYPEDPEPEYIDINALNVAAVTLQENNAIVLVALATGRILRAFDAGTVDLTNIDTVDQRPNLIELTSSLSDVPREPDGITWLSPLLFATADEGDLAQGGRGFTVFSVTGHPVFNTGNTAEHAVARAGHLDDRRSDSKGLETESVASAVIGGRRYLVVGNERAGSLLIYEVGFGGRPQLLQVLPTGVRPEGLAIIPSRGIIVAASEDDARADTYRATLSIFRLSHTPNYPTVVSANRPDGTPIPWAALSGLASHPSDDDTLYSVYDSFFQKSRIFTMDISHRPAVIKRELVLKDTFGRLAAQTTVKFDVYEDEDDNGTLEPGELVEANRMLSLASRVNADHTVNLDPEGITTAADGTGFWLASEGAGNLLHPLVVNPVSNLNDQPFVTPNLLVEVAANGDITDVVSLPAELAEKQFRFGFEGVASVVENGVEVLYVAFQRAWTRAGDVPETQARIGRYDTSAKTWTFAYYPLDLVESPLGGWVGLSEITALGKGEFLIVERDNAAGDDARVKKVYRIDVAATAFAATPSDILGKVLVRDLVPDLVATGGAIQEKVEGLAALKHGKIVIVTDNDGVNGLNGETQLLVLRAH